MSTSDADTNGGDANVEAVDDDDSDCGGGEYIDDGGQLGTLLI